MGALLGEVSTNKSFQDSLKPAFGSFIGVIAGSVIKFLISLSFLFFYFDIFRHVINVVRAIKCHKLKIREKQKNSFGGCARPNCFKNFKNC